MSYISKTETYPILGFCPTPGSTSGHESQRKKCLGPPLGHWIQLGLIPLFATEVSVLRSFCSHALLILGLKICLESNFLESKNSISVFTFNLKIHAFTGEGEIDIPLIKDYLKNIRHFHGVETRQSAADTMKRRLKEHDDRKIEVVDVLGKN